MSLKPSLYTTGAGTLNSLFPAVSKHESFTITMLTRLYADNFRCLVNFDLKLDRLNLLMGTNGSGKSSIFEVLRRLQQFLSGDCKIQRAFPFRELTRWQMKPLQRFELNLTIGEYAFTYGLTVEHEDLGAKCRVKEETLYEDDQPLYAFHMGEVQLFRDNHTAGPAYPYDWTLPAMAGIQSSKDNKKLTMFRKQIANLVVAGISPSQMENESREEAAQLSPRMENFVSWYRRVSQENLGAQMELFTALENVLPGFASFSFKDVGEESKVLKILFGVPGAGKKDPALRIFGAIGRPARPHRPLHAPARSERRKPHAFSR